MVAHAVDPAGQANGGAYIGLGECGTGMAAISVHHDDLYLLNLLESETGACRSNNSHPNRAEKRMTVLICQGKSENVDPLELKNCHI